MTAIPELHPKCPICHSEYRFIIQKAIDEEDDDILRKYNILPLWLTKHKYENHRNNLIMWGAMDAKVRSKGIKVGIELADFILKWREGLKQRAPESIKDSDAINALKLYSQVEGSLVERHEVTITKSVDQAIKDFLDAKDIKDKENKEVGCEVPKEE